MDFGFIDLECFAQHLKVGGKEQCAVKEGSLFKDTFGTAGNFSAGDQNVVTAGKFCSDPHPAQGGDDDFSVAGKSLRVKLAVIGGDGVIHIAGVVVDGTAAGDPAHHLNFMFSDKIGIDFRFGILVASDDDRRGVAPQHQHFTVVLFGEQLFQRQIEWGVQRRVYHYIHR